MRRITLSILTLAILLQSYAAFGQADRRIRFAKGRTSATVKGTIPAGGRICYAAGARRGQALTATVSSRSGRVRIFESGGTAYTYEIEQSGDQSICVDNLSRATTFSLSVSIR
ncbi:MAG TPA: hypothetical protein PKD24_04690 [Pyrinomonadaceae bacterium]|nr:hypothetical protein [Pyrinomonadaceae bacterium]HMP64850.1 hypothetical protein [Pyrinomonadaceae bacterium]